MGQAYLKKAETFLAGRCLNNNILNLKFLNFISYTT